MLWRYERMASAMGYQVVAGVDEVGMGPLAGPVVGGAVVLPIGIRIPGLDDSKLLNAEQRERLDRAIRRRAMAVSVCAVDHAQVDSLGLLRARHLATAGAVARAQQAKRVDLGVVHRADRHRHRAPADGAVEALALLGVQELRVVEAGNPD